MLFNGYRLLVIEKLFFEDEVEYGELYEHCYTHDDDGGNEAVDAYLHTCPEEHNMQQEIDSMTATESDEAFPWRRSMESEVCRGEVVHEEWNNIADGVWCVYLDEQLTQQIYGIVYSCWEASVEDKAHELCFACIAMEYGVEGIQV